MKCMKNLHIALVGLAGALLMGCAGVNPSVELGFLYTPPPLPPVPSAQAYLPTE